MKTLFFLLALLSLSAFADTRSPIQEGDIIFHQTQSGQAAALREITGSVWTHVGIVIKQGTELYVAEAARRVEVTPLRSFIERGFQEKYIVKRVRPELLEMNQANLKKLKLALSTFAGKGYDVWFQWSDDVIYCSELVWKAFDKAFGLKISDLEKFRDFPMNGPEAQRLIRERYTNQGRSFNMNETVISPVGILESSQLIDVYREE